MARCDRAGASLCAVARWRSSGFCAEHAYLGHRASGRIALQLEPRATAADVLPVLPAGGKAVDALVGLREGTRARVRQRLQEFEFLQFTRPAVGTGQLAHCRTGNGPAPRSSSRCPVANRERRNAEMSSGALPVATSVAQAAPEAGIALKPP